METKEFTHSASALFSPGLCSIFTNSYPLKGTQNLLGPISEKATRHILRNSWKMLRRTKKMLPNKNHRTILTVYPLKVKSMYRTQKSHPKKDFQIYKSTWHLSLPSKPQFPTISLLGKDFPPLSLELLPI